jgi:hypothetical protein
MSLRYKDITYSLFQRKRRKTASIHVERDGAVSVIVPDTLTTKEIERLIETKRRWIYRQLAEWQDLNVSRLKREFVNGEGFLYLGRSYRLKMVQGQEKPLLLKDGYFCLRKSELVNGNADTAFREFYRKKGLARIPDRVGIYQTRIGVRRVLVRVMDLKNRWASCSSRKDALNFHWKCMMAPLTVLDYIIVHELVHLLQPNHTPKFWAEVEKLIPDYVERKGWLRVNGAALNIG